MFYDAFVVRPSWLYEVPTIEVVVFLLVFQASP